MLEKFERFWGFGFLCIIATASLQTANHMLSRQLTSSNSELLGDLKGLHPMWLVTFRQFSMLLITAPQIPITKANYLPHGKSQWWPILLRAVCGGSALCCTQISLSLIPVGDFATIFSMVPLVTTILSWPILGERMKVLDVPVVISAISGVLLIVRPSFLFGDNLSRTDSNYIIGCLLTMAGVVFQVFSSCFPKKNLTNCKPVWNVHGSEKGKKNTVCHSHIYVLYFVAWHICCSYSYYRRIKTTSMWYIV